MKAYALRAVQKLSLDDILQLVGDHHLYRVLALEKLLGGRWKVTLRSMDGAVSAKLVRPATDLVFVVPGGALLH